MKLPKGTNIGFASPQVADNSSQILGAYSKLANGIKDMSNVMRDIETTRLDEEQASSAHDYDLDKINFETEQYGVDFYAGDDPALEGLSVKRTESAMVNGELVEQERSEIPAHEVWPQLFARAGEDRIKNYGSQISSQPRRTAFEQAASEGQARDIQRAVKQTAAKQAAYHAEKREIQISRLREIGTPEALDNISGIISGIKDPIEKAQLKDWWAPVKVADTNTATIADHILRRDDDGLDDKYNEFLGYASGKIDYTGPLSPNEIEREANRFKHARNEIRVLNKGDSSANMAHVKRYGRDVINQLNKGYPVDPAETTEAYLNVSAALEADPDNETLATMAMDIERAQESNTLFRDVITTYDQNDPRTTIERAGDFLDITMSSKMTVDDRAKSERASAISNSFINSMRTKPMDAMLQYGLAGNTEHTIEPIDFKNPETLLAQIGQRDASYQYYRGIHGYTGDPLLVQERDSLNFLLGDDQIAPKDKLGVIAGIAMASGELEGKFWGSSIDAPQAGKFAAIGQLMEDYESLGRGAEGWQTGLNIMRGYDRWADDSTIVEDYQGARGTMRRMIGENYHMYPAVMEQYMSNAMAYAIATEPGEQVDEKAIKKAFNQVSGGLVDFEGSVFMSPRAGLDEAGFKDWMMEYDPSNFKGGVLGYSNEQVSDGIVDGAIKLRPTGTARTDFYLMNRNGERLTDGRTKRAYIFSYDPTAERRPPPKRTSVPYTPVLF